MRQWFKHTARGMCMGVADIIPGVSGGTLALILGIYERFIRAISGIGIDLLKAVFSKAFWARLKQGLKRPGDEGDDALGQHASNVLFLIFLGVGIMSAVLIGARFIPDLLDRYPAQMKGLFLGLVAASVMIPYRHMQQKVRKATHPVHLTLTVVLAVATFFIVGMPMDTSGNAHGHVALTFPQATEAPIRLTVQDALFMTATHGGDNVKREVVFAPTTDVVVPAGQTSFSLPVRARMMGEMANLSAGQISVAKVDGLPEGTTVTNAAGTSGGANPALWFVFLAGFIAISAMVLPGISGSFLLLIFGLYHFITFNVRAAVYDRQAEAFVYVGVFSLAMVVGILLFSRFLNWLLRNFHDATMAALAGIMVGSLRKLWPFSQTNSDGNVENVLPGALDSTVIVTAALCVIGAVAVTALERYGRRAAAQA